MKTYSIIINWNDRDAEQGTFGSTVRARTPKAAERKVRAEMWEIYAGAEDRKPTAKEIRETGGSVVEMHEGALWRAPEMEATLRKLLEWEKTMGGWEAPAWAEARKLIASIDKGN
jgi:hypothetical protein